MRRRNLLIAGTAALVWIVVLLGSKYRRYEYAVLWHCVHGNQAEVAGHKVTLPLLWWAENDPDRYDTTLLVRASIGRFPFEVIVSLTLPGSVRNTEQEELALVQAVIAQLNHYETTNQNSIVKHPTTLVTIASKAFNLYCQKENSTAYGISFLSTLMCYTAGDDMTLATSGDRNMRKKWSRFSHLWNN